MKCGNFKFCQIRPFLFKVHNCVGCILQLKRNIRGVFISVIRRDLQFQQAPPFVYSYILVWESGCSPICNDSEFFPLWSFQNFRDAHFSNKETMLISSLAGYFCLLYISVNLLSNSNTKFFQSQHDIFCTENDRTFLSTFESVEHLRNFVVGFCFVCSHFRVVPIQLKQIMK